MTILNEQPLNVLLLQNPSNNTVLYYGHHDPKGAQKQHTLGTLDKGTRNISKHSLGLIDLTGVSASWDLFPPEMGSTTQREFHLDYHVVLGKCLLYRYFKELTLVVQQHLVARGGKEHKSTVTGSLTTGNGPNKGR